jgi:hypothetical protein
MSAGAYAAAVTAGVLNLADDVRMMKQRAGLVAKRGFIMNVGGPSID